MALIEFGLIYKNEKNVIFSNLNKEIVYDTSYDLNSVPIIDWSISETYTDELREIRFKNHFLIISKCFVGKEKVYCYFIRNRETAPKTQKKLDKLFSRLEKKKQFSSLNELKILCFSYLIKNSVIQMKHK